MEEESITDATNVTADIFSHFSSAHRENAKLIFTIEKLDKLDELVDSVKNLTINNAKYYELNTATTSDAQGDLPSKPETVTHTIKVVFKQRILSCRTIHIFTSPTNPGTAVRRPPPPMILDLDAMISSSTILDPPPPPTIFSFLVQQYVFHGRFFCGCPARPSTAGPP